MFKSLEKRSGTNYTGSGILFVFFILLMGYQPAFTKDRGQTTLKGEKCEVYIIKFSEKPLLTYEGGFSGYPPTAPSKTGRKLDLHHPAESRYRNYLKQQRLGYTNQIQNTLGRTILIIRTYEVSFFGMALEVSASEVQLIKGLPGVDEIQPDEMRTLLNKPKSLP